MNLIIEIYDSEFLYPKYLPQSNELHLVFTLWNGTNAKIVFKGVIAFCFHYIPCNTIGMRIQEQETEFLHTALIYEYENIPSIHDFHCYELLNIDDHPCVKIVAKEYQFLCPAPLDICEVV